MSIDDILKAFAQILSGLLGSDSITLTEDTERRDVPDWDSFNYVNFIVAVEMRFGVKFGVAEVESFRTVGEIARRVQGLAAGRAR